MSEERRTGAESRERAEAGQNIASLDCRLVRLTRERLLCRREEALFPAGGRRRSVIFTCSVIE